MSVAEGLVGIASNLFLLMDDTAMTTLVLTHMSRIPKNAVYMTHGPIVAEEGLLTPSPS